MSRGAACSRGWKVGRGCSCVAFQTRDFLSVCLQSTILRGQSGECPMVAGLATRWVGDEAGRGSSSKGITSSCCVGGGHHGCGHERSVVPWIVKVGMGHIIL